MILDRDKERLLTIHSSALDIARWVLGMVIVGRLSRDRRSDIIHACERIIKDIKELVS